MKQRIPINSITSKLVLKSMYASCSTGPFFADHYSHRFEKTQLKFRQEKWLPVKISCIIWNEICKKKKLIKNRNGIFCQKFLIFLKSLKSLNKNFYSDSLFSAWTFIYWKYLFEKQKTKIFLSRHILFAKNIFAAVLRLIFNNFHSGLKACFSSMRTQLSEQDRRSRPLRWNMSRGGSYRTKINFLMWTKWIIML